MLAIRPCSKVHGAVLNGWGRACADAERLLGLLLHRTSLKGFVFTPAQYSLAFAFVGLLSSLAPIIFGILSKSLGTKRCITVALVVALCLAVAFAVLERATWMPFVAVLGACFALGTAIQPALANVLLSSRDEDIGSASAMLAAFPQAMGTVGMFLVTLPLLDYLGRMAVLTVGSLVVSLVAWVSVAYGKDVRGFEG
ncbi:MAG: hypothetical protein ACI36V_05385 [Coriobacteriales bacterium]